MKQILTLLIFLLAQSIVGQTLEDSSLLIGKWNRTRSKMVDIFRVGKHKENGLLEINSDGTYKTKNSVAEITGKWSINGKFLTYVNDKATYSVKIVRLTKTKLVTSSSDGSARFRTHYSRVKD